MMNRRTALATALACAVPGAASGPGAVRLSRLLRGRDGSGAQQAPDHGRYIRQQIDLVES